MNRVARRERLTAALAERDLAGFLVTTPTQRPLPDGLHRLQRRRLPGHRGALPDRFPLRHVGGAAGRRLAGRDRRAEPARATSPAASPRSSARERVGFEASGALLRRLARARRGRARRRRRARAVRPPRRGSARRQGRRRDRADPRAAASSATRSTPGWPRTGLAGREEREVAWAIEQRARELGAEGASFPPIVASGANGALPHAVPGALEIERSTLVVLDLGALVGGYCSDCTRTFATGPSEPQMMDVYETVLARAGGRARARAPRAGLPARCTRRRGA